MWVRVEVCDSTLTAYAVRIVQLNRAKACVVCVHDNFNLLCIDKCFTGSAATSRKS